MSILSIFTLYIDDGGDEMDHGAEDGLAVPSSAASHQP
jgi:hypothetical protein